MKKIIAALALLAIVSPAKADLYNDSTGDTFFGGILDIASVEVTDDATDITFTMTLVGDIGATDWGNYMYHIDTNSSTGDVSTPIGNPWARPISYTPDGADYWLGAWVNGGGGWQHWSYSGGSWGMNSQTGLNSLGQFSFSIKTSIASLGLSPGDSFCFDAYASGADGNPGAIDSLGNPNQQVNDWNVASNAHPVCYTTTPEPGSLALLAIGALAMLRRRR